MTLDDDEIEEILDKGDFTNLFSKENRKKKECEAIETRNNEIQEASNFSNTKFELGIQIKNFLYPKKKREIVKLSDVLVN